MATTADSQETQQLREDIDKIVAQIKNAIVEVSKDAPVGQTRVAVTEADLTLNVAVEKTAGGDAKFKLFGHDFGAKGELTRADTQTIELKLKPSLEDAIVFGEADVSKKLVDAMKAIRESVSDAATGEPHFALGEASVELNFQIEKDGSIDFFATGEAKKTNVQTVKLTLGPG